MTERYAHLHARHHSASQLSNVVTAMRGIAAARAQQGRRQLDNVQAYADTVARAISQVLAIAPALPSDGRERHGRMLLLICAEHGFAGAFSERILDAAGVASADDIRWVIGSRGGRLAHARGWLPAWSAPMVSQLGNAGGLADRVATELYRHLHAGDIRGFDVIHARPLAPEGYEVVRRALLPFDYARFSAAEAALPPLLNLPPKLLLERLAGEYLFAQLNEAIVQSYAAENAARLQTMTAARENIQRRLETLTREERLARQEEITAEIIELASGTEALRPRRRRGGR
jgi:F-type H+-transporting ATPase subunit gamma